MRQEAQAKIEEASKAILVTAQKEEAELEATIDSARTALESDVQALTDDLVAKALGRSV